MNIQKNLSRMIIITTLVGVFTFSTSAQAQGLEILSGIVILFIVDEVVMFAGGTVTGIGCGVELADDYPSIGWIIPTYVLGGLNLVNGGMLMSWEIFTDIAMPLGISHLALGTADIIIASIAVHKRQVWKEKFAMSPVILADYRGDPVMGVGIVFKP